MLLYIVNWYFLSYYDVEIINTLICSANIFEKCLEVFEMPYMFVNTDYKDANVSKTHA